MGMDPVKLQFITEFINKTKPQNMKDAMPFLIANMNLAKKKNINFSKTEIQLIADILCQNLSPQEQQKVKQIMSMLGQI
jgi:hypothetical protein